MIFSNGYIHCSLENSQRQYSTSCENIEIRIMKKKSHMKLCTVYIKRSIYVCRSPFCTQCCSMNSSSVLSKMNISPATSASLGWKYGVGFHFVAGAWRDKGNGTLRVLASVPFILSDLYFCFLSTHQRMNYVSFEFRIQLV